jgi:hypothetical protein
LVAHSLFPAPHHQNTAPKSHPPNPCRATLAHNVEETTRKNVSAAKKIARDAKKVPEIRAKFEGAQRLFSPQYQLLSRWLGCQDSKREMAK